MTKDSHNKILCEVTRQKVSARLRGELGPFLRPITRRFLRIPVTDYPIGCRICQYDVPCMDRNPMTTPPA